jgi:hypothetical protein
MEQLRLEPDLYEDCHDLITRSRRVRVELDTEWKAHIRERMKNNGYCLTLLTEASARLAARERDRVEGAHRVIEDLF